MNASSQKPQTPGALPPLVPVPVPLQAAVDGYRAAQGDVPPTGPAVPAHPVVNAVAPQLPECFTCGTQQSALVPCPRGSRYPSGAQVLYCRTHVPDVPAAEAGEDTAPPAPSAAATATEVTAYVAQVVEAIAEAPNAQARATLQAELEQAAEDHETMEWFHRRLLETAPVQAGCEAVRRLCEGRPVTHHLSVEQILTALDGHAPPAAPMALTWDGILTATGKTIRVPVRTTLGAEAVLELDAGQRRELRGQLAALTPATEACDTPGCGMGPGEIAQADPPPLLGWILVDVVGAGAGPRWWCSPDCASAAIANAGTRLAAADQAAAVDPGQQAPSVPTADVAKDGTDAEPVDGEGGAR